MVGGRKMSCRGVRCTELDNWIKLVALPILCNIADSLTVFTIARLKQKLRSRTKIVSGKRVIIDPILEDLDAALTNIVYEG